MNKKTITTVAKIMQYKKSLTTSVIAITLAMMFTATIPFQQQEAYASHEGLCPTGSIALHVGGVDAACGTPEFLEQACAAGVPYDECEPELPLDERYPNQGTCIHAGEDKDDC